MTQTPTDALRLVPVEPTREQWLWAARIVRELGPSMSPGAMAMTMERLAEKAAPASPLPGGGWPVHIVRACGATVDEQRLAVLNSETYKHGDMVLAWVSEGDLYGNPFVELEQIPADPTGDA